MSGEWLLVVVPVVFVLGWFSARLDIRHVRKNASELPHAYLAGLSHLLRDETGKALDAFLQAQPMDPESAELQFSIGELSRRRGEHRRALQIHHHLCRREDLPAAVRRRSFWELAQDYFHMGFLDFAEQYAYPLLKEKPHRERATDMMMAICQRRGDYQKIMAMARDLPPEVMLPRRVGFAHLYCECAMRSGDAGEKQTRLREALKINPDCARANILLGELALSLGDGDDAARHFSAVENQSPKYLWRAVDGFMRAARARDRALEGRDEIMRWLQAHPSAMMFESVYWVLAEDGVAADIAARELAQHGYPTAAVCWIDEKIAAVAAAERRCWQALKNALSEGGKMPFACAHCGYEVGRFAWQCAGCESWESFVPRRTP